MNAALASEVRDGVLPVGNCRSNADELLDLLKGPAWRADALCREYPDLQWFGKSQRSSKAAKAVCGACLVRTECLSYAMADPALDGIWGGLTTRERSQRRNGAPDALADLTATA